MRTDQTDKQTRFGFEDLDDGSSRKRTGDDDDDGEIVLGMDSNP